jgi:metal-responsive CopG/Arc/MetJ family transcriptional regulator
MPSEKGDKQAVTIWVDKGLVVKIEALAEKGGLTRSKLITNLIEVGVEELVAMNKLGMWATLRVFEDIRQYFKKRHIKKEVKAKIKNKE